MSATWLITGATSGFGRLIADRALADDAHVVAVGRRASLLTELAATHPGQVTPVVLDVTEPQAEQVLSDVIADVGGVDVVVNNAGYGLFGSLEQTMALQARALFDTNVLANLTVLRVTLPSLRERRGRIVQLSSLMGSFAWPATSLYSATKAAVELFSEGLALELAPSGVKVIVVQPGVFGTDFAANARIIAADETYAATVGARLDHFMHLPPESFGDPTDVVDAIMTAVTMAEPPMRIPVGQDAITSIGNALRGRLDELAEYEPAGAPGGR